MANRMRAFRFRPIPTLLTAIMLVVLIGLGTWQIDRLMWKRDLIATIETQMAAEPVPLPAGPLDPEAWSYRRVTVSGEYLHDRTQRLLNRTYEGRAGAHLIIPLVRSDRAGAGGVVLVDRGWVPGAAASDADAPIDQPQGEVRVAGVLIAPEAGGFLAGEPFAGGNEWLSLDVDAMAQAVGYPGAMRLVLYAEDRGPGYPVGGQARIDIPNNHLQYVFTWYSLAIVLLVIFLIFSRNRPAGEPGSRGGKP